MPGESCFMIPLESNLRPYKASFGLQGRLLPIYRIICLLGCHPSIDFIILDCHPQGKLISVHFCYSWLILESPLSTLPSYVDFFEHISAFIAFYWVNNCCANSLLVSHYCMYIVEVFYCSFNGNRYCFLLKLSLI